ncbi:glycosyltransferase [Streptomyces sp. NPDC015171]|uniref:glycosyltransferase n=1 Tax=Streptomyces sp. NPDC015171 TaxID=3364945 RepID=UPI0036F6A729
MHQPARAPGPRVLHLAQPVDGGVARVVLDLARAQLAAGLSVTAACPGGALAADLRELGADVRHWQAARSPGPGLPGEVRRLARLIEEVRPELVHAHSAKAGLAARLAVRGRIPTVYQPHAWSFEAVGGATAALALRWERWGARWADRVVCVSEAERATGLRAGVRAAYTVVPNGIDTTRFAPAPPTEPTASPTEPAAPPAEPTVASIEPTVASTEPTAPPAEPTVASTEPTAPPAEPTVASIEPTVASTEPTAPSAEPTVASVEPTVASTEPTSAGPPVPPTKPAPATTTAPPTTTTAPPADPAPAEQPSAEQPPAIQPSAAQPSAEQPSASRAPAAQAPAAVTGPLVVCVGRLCRQKGQDVLVRAWEDVVAALPGARLVLVGDGPDHAALRRRAHPSVRFTGAVTDVVPWYRAADLVVLPSRWEGMALAPLEALGCGRAVVLTDVDGARESLPPALAARCLVPPEDPGALARAVTGLLSDPPLRAALGAQGRRHVMSRHDVRHTAERIAALYRELLGRTPAATGEPAQLVPSECRESSHP